MKRRVFLIAAFGALAPLRGWATSIGTVSSAPVTVFNHDVVAYFTQAAAVEGKQEFSAEAKGIVYFFATEENRVLFSADPAKYLPQYGGHCAYAAAKGALAPGDPKAWTVTGGKLYLNLSPAIRETWLEDLAGNISRADANWPKLSK